MRAVFDTNILIDHLNGVRRAALEIARYSAPLISPITWMEVMAGAAHDKDRSALRAFLTNFDLAPITQDVMEFAARLRSEKRLRLPDAIILATALTDDLILVSRNIKDFDVKAWPNIRVPYDLRS